MTTIQVRTQFEGVHCYPRAPDEVAYLKQLHRHIFGVCVEVEVFNEDRELEFVVMKHLVDKYINSLPKQDGCCVLYTFSCETIAKNILNHVKEKVDDPHERYWKVTVDEDGENGASVEYRRTDQLPSGLEAGYSLRMVLSKMLEMYDEQIGACWTLDKYQRYAYQSIQKHSDEKEEVMHWAIGLGEEAGETLSIIKHRYYGGNYKDNGDMLEDLINELGDVLWHVSALCTVLGINLEDVAKYNVAKLANRYPSGEFNQERSENRHEVDGMWKEKDSYRTMMERIKGGKAGK